MKNQSSSNPSDADLLDDDYTTPDGQKNIVDEDHNDQDDGDDAILAKAERDFIESKKAKP